MHTLVSKVLTSDLDKYNWDIMEIKLNLVFLFVKEHGLAAFFFEQILQNINFAKNI